MLNIILENTELIEENFKKNDSVTYKRGSSKIDVKGDLGIRLIVKGDYPDNINDDEIDDKDKRIELELNLKVDVTNKDSDEVEATYMSIYRFTFNILGIEDKRRFLKDEMEEVELFNYMNNMVNLGYANIRNDIQELFFKAKFGLKIPYNINLKEIK